ncbi:hypothetical protein WG66_008388 [Moniliophthora roreri]|nr:hypothetical protein WG66_008388 [Moniliophthora roreri]
MNHRGTLSPNEYFFLRPVVFQVEDELFQLPEILFPISDTFKVLYPAIGTESGKTSVLRLSDCTKRAFEAFLTVILRPYNTMFPGNGTHPCSKPLQLEVLVPALELAMRWGFHELARELADQAQRLIQTARDKVVLGRRWGVHSWFRAGLEELVMSEDDISMEDAEMMGFPFALRVYHARSRYAREIRNREDLDGVVANVVEAVFEKDLGPEFASSRVQDTTVQPPARENKTETIIVESEDVDNEDVDNVVTEQAVYAEPEVITVVKEEEVPHVAISEPDIITEDELHDDNDDDDDDIQDMAEQERGSLVHELIHAIIDPMAPRSSPRLLAAIPKDCIKQENNCGLEKRCMHCCIKYAQAHGQTWLPQAKTAGGQVFLDRALWRSAHPDVTEEVIRYAPKMCLKASTKCGELKRCAECCSRKARSLLFNGEII